MAGNERAGAIPTISRGARELIEDKVDDRVILPTMRYRVDRTDPVAMPASAQVLDTLNNAVLSSFFTIQLFKHAKTVVDKPTASGQFTPWHYAMFSAIAGLAIVSWVNNIRLAAKSPNINTNTITGLTIQTSVATTLATTVLGGFAKKSLAAAGPFGFFVINGFMFCKSMGDVFCSYWNARTLKANGYGDTLAYRTYIQGTKDHLKAASWHVLATTAIALVVTFAPYVAVGVSLVAAGVKAGAKILQTVPKLWQGVKRMWRWARQEVTSNHVGNNDMARSQSQVASNPVSASAISIQTADCVTSHMTCQTHIDELKQWKESRKNIQREAGLRGYDRRFHYRDDQLSAIANTSSCQDTIKLMRDRVLAILHLAIEDYELKSRFPRFLVNASQLRRKFELSKKLAALVAATKGGAELSPQMVHDTVSEFNSGLFKRGALGSVAKRVGGMQSVVEVVEFYVAFCKAGGDVKKIDTQTMRYQYSNAFSITGSKTESDNVPAYNLRMSDVADKASVSAILTP